MKSLFVEVYSKFKLQFYRKIFTRFESREASLTAVETFCVEVISALGEPTISNFAEFVNISQANAAYKIQSLVKKGYIEKRQSETDRREYHLIVTERFEEYRRINFDYVEAVTDRMEDRFTDEEIATFTRMLKIISEELTPEIPLYDSTSE